MCTDKPKSSAACDVEVLLCIYRWHWLYVDTGGTLQGCMGEAGVFWQAVRSDQFAFVRSDHL